MDSFLITSNYRGKNKSTIWHLTLNNKGSILKEIISLKVYDNALLPSLYDQAAWGITKCKHGYALSEVNGVRLLDFDFKKKKRFQDIDLLKDLHDICSINDKLYVANSGHDRIEVFNLELNHLQSIDLHSLPFLKDFRVTSKKNSLSVRDCFHVNRLTAFKGNIYFTLSFVNRSDGYSLSKKFPFVKKSSQQSPGLVYNLSKREIFVDSLKAAHDGFWKDENLWVIQSHNMSIDIYNINGKLHKRKEFKHGAFYRGLAICDKYVIVGITKIDSNRKAAHRYKRYVENRGGKFLEFAGLAILNRSNLELIEYIKIPVWEDTEPTIYKVINKK